MTVSIEPGLRPLVRKLERLGPLSDEERQTLEGFIPGARWVGAARSLTRQGERPTACCLIVEGFACRYKALDDGQRQILSFHIPGDLLDLAGLLLGRMDYGVATLTAVRAVSVPNATLLDWIGRTQICTACCGATRCSTPRCFASGWSTSAAARPISVSRICCASW